MNPILETILLGALEGVTEFLPISSTAHLLLAERLMGVHRSDAFNIIIQLGAICAVVLVYRAKLADLALHAFQPDNRDYLAKLATSFAITVALCLAWDGLPDSPWPVIAALAGGAALILAAEWWLQRHDAPDAVSWPVAVAVGLGQAAAAFFPGLSRSGATIIAAMLCGQSRKGATEYSFIIGIPTMFAASAKAGYDAWETGGLGPEGALHLAIGFAVSMATAFAAVIWLITFVRANTFTPFAWYRLALAAALAAYLAA